MRVILVHGILSNGDKSIDLLIPGLEAKGYEVVQYNYGPRGPLGSLLHSNKDAKGLVGMYKEGDVVIGHSNGCKLIALAIEMGMPVEYVIMVHAALNVKWIPPYDHPVKKVYVYYSLKDRATWWAQWSPWKWGGMGTYGPSTEDKRLVRKEEDQTHSEGFREHPDKYHETL